MTKEKIFVTRMRVPDAVERLREWFDVEVWSKPTPPPDTVLIDQVRKCSAILSEADDKIDSAVLSNALQLRVVANRAIGLDNIDVPTATKRGILVGNTPGILHESCADFTFGLILDVARNLSYSNKQVVAGEWKFFDQTPYLGTDVHDKVLGLVGFGLIGRTVARRAAGFNMKVLYYSRTRKPEHEDSIGVQWVPDLPGLLKKSDYVSIHIPLTDQTRHYIGTRELDYMKPTAFLINTSRGGTVDSNALREALAQGGIAGAALDVTDPEPIDPDDPLVTMKNVVVTPHIASATASTLRSMGLMAADNIIAGLTGTPMPSCVNFDAVQLAK